MKRAIKFKLKNGKEVVIRPLKADDYDAFVKFYKEFVNGPSAKMNFEYSGAPVAQKEHYVNAWTNKNFLYIAAFDGNKIVGYSQIRKLMANHPFSGRSAMTGTSILEKYTSNGLGAKFKAITEKWARENNVHKLEAETFTANTRSVANLLKSGFQIVGTLHDVAFIDGEWYHQYNFEKILES